MSEQLEFLLDNLPNLLIGFPNNRPGGLIMSLLLAAFGLGVGFGVAVAVGSAYDSRYRLVRWMAGAYVGIFRGIPLVLLLLIVFQLMGGRTVLGVASTPLTAALVALVLYSSAYQANIIHTGLRAVPERIVEDARVLGGRPRQVYRTVKLSYGLRVMTPALTGQAITLFKDTSVVVILGVADLTTTARIALGSDVANAPFWLVIYLAVGFLYFLVAFGLSRAARRLEIRLQRGDLVHSLARLAGG